MVLLLLKNSNTNDPDIDKPILQVRVSWPGASPDDVEREIITRLERSISSLSGVEKIESDSRYGSGRVTLTYNIGENIDMLQLNC